MIIMLEKRPSEFPESIFFATQILIYLLYNAYTAINASILLLVIDHLK